MEPKQSSKIKRKVMFIILIIASILVVMVFTAFIIAHSYINKMNLVTAAEDSGHITTFDETEISAVEKENPEEEFELEPEVEEADPNVPEASENEINSIEEGIDKNLDESSTPILYDKDVYNVLLIGCDTRKAGGVGRSDAMILVSINEKKKTITVTSILRDIYLQIPGKKNNRINAAYAFGGADLLMETIKQNFKIQIDQYASVDFYAFIDVVDAIGGVTLEVTEKEIPVMNSYIKGINLLTNQSQELDCLSKTGIQLLNGKQVLGYVRNRYVGNNDFDRTARQRKVLELIFNQVKSLDLIELTDLLDVLLPQVTTNISEGQIFTLMLSLPAYVDYDLEQWSVPVSGSYSSRRIRGMSVLGIDFETNINELRGKIYE